MTNVQVGSNDYTYNGGAATPSPKSLPTDTVNSLAAQAAKQLGWNSLFVSKQWSLETGNFSSNVWKTDNNPAGIKWYPGMTDGTKGTPASDGGYYAHFDSPVTGYVDFVKNNPRYSNVGASQDPYTEAQTIAKDGWATDPNYASKLMGMTVNGNQSVNVGTGAGSVVGGGGPSGNILTNFGGYLQAALAVVIGGGIVILGIWVALNPFSDLTTAITSTIKQFSKMPLEGATKAVKDAPNKVRQNRRNEGWKTVENKSKPKAATKPEPKPKSKVETKLEQKRHQKKDPNYTPGLHDLGSFYK